MDSQQRQHLLGAGWILSAGLVGLVANVASVGGAALVLVMGLVPPALLMLRRSPPASVVRIHHVKP